MKKIHKVLFIIVMLVLIASLAGNGWLYHEWRAEQGKLKNAIVPTLNDDYFLTHQFLVQLAQDGDIFYDTFDERTDSAGEEFVSGEITYSDNGREGDFVEIKRLSQLPDYPNGCEAASAVMLLNYAGIDITLREFIDNYLPMQNVYENDGKRYGPNPARYYAGDPSNEKRGWGCFAPVIADSIVRVINNGNLADRFAVDEYSCLPLTDLGVPLIIWVTADYEPADEVYEWQSFDGRRTYTYPKNSHTVLLVGYDGEYYYINDPLRPDETVKVEREKLIKCYDSMGRQAIGITLWEADEEYEGDL